MPIQLNQYQPPHIPLLKLTHMNFSSALFYTVLSTDISIEAETDVVGRRPLCEHGPALCYAMAMPQLCSLRLVTRIL